MPTSRRSAGGDGTHAATKLRAASRLRHTSGHPHPPASIAASVHATADDTASGTSPSATASAAGSASPPHDSAQVPGPTGARQELTVRTGSPASRGGAHAASGRNGRTSR